MDGKKIESRTVCRLSELEAISIGLRGTSICMYKVVRTVCCDAYLVGFIRINLLSLGSGSDDL